MLAYMTYVLSSLAQHVGFFAGQPAFSQALKRSSFISWDELSSPKKFFRFTVLGECHFVLPSMVNTNSSYKLSPSFDVKQCLAFWTESGSHRLILSVHHILDLQIIRLVKKKESENFVIYFNHSGYSQCHHSFAVSNDHCLWMSKSETWTFKKRNKQYWTYALCLD